MSCDKEKMEASKINGRPKKYSSDEERGDAQKKRALEYYYRQKALKNSDALKEKITRKEDLQARLRIVREELLQKLSEIERLIDAQ
jgi:hypothetical protein